MISEIIGHVTDVPDLYVSRILFWAVKMFGCQDLLSGGTFPGVRRPNIWGSDIPTPQHRAINPLTSAEHFCVMVGKNFGAVVAFVGQSLWNSYYKNRFESFVELL